MPWPFCTVCGNVLTLPIAGDIVCSRCNHRATYESFGEVEVVTRSAPRPPPRWYVEQQQSGGEMEKKRATVEEPCPKCNYPQCEFYTMQLRSADEGQTVFYECLNKSCRYKYSVNN